MAIVINPTPHPEEPPVIRGPKAADIMRNAHAFPNQGPPRDMQRDFSNEYQTTSPPNRPHPSGFGGPGSSSYVSSPGHQFASSGIVSPPVTGPQASAQSGYAFGPALAGRQRSGAAGASFNAMRSRAGTVGDNNPSVRPGPGMADGNNVGPRGWGAREVVEAAFAKLSVRQQEQQADQYRDELASLHLQNFGVQANAALNPMAQGFGGGRGQPQADMPSQASNRGRGGSYGRPAPSMQSPGQASAAFVPSTSLAGPAASAPGSKPPSGPRGRRNTKAIPIVDPNTSQMRSTSDTNNDSSNLNMILGETEPSGSTSSAVEPGPMSGSGGLGGQGAAIRKQPCDINVSAAKKFAGNNSFGALRSDDTDDEPDVPGGVRI